MSHACVIYARSTGDVEMVISADGEDKLNEAVALNLTAETMSFELAGRVRPEEVRIDVSGPQHRVEVRPRQPVVAASRRR